MTVAVPPDWATRLIDLLDQQRRIYSHLEQMSARQTHLVQAGQTEPLLTLLAQRQRLIDQLTQVAGNIEPFKKDWPALFAQLDLVSRGRIQSLINQVQELLGRIMSADERDRVALTEQRGRLSVGLQQVAKGSVLNRAYQSGGVDPETHNRYTDEQG